MQHVIPDYRMDEEEMSHSGSHHSGPSPYPQGSYGGSNSNPHPQRMTYRGYGAPSAQPVPSEGDISLKRDREREGRCSECGVQTHEFLIDPQTGQTRKVPLTVEHEVHRGRCLFCYPLSPAHLAAAAQHNLDTSGSGHGPVGHQSGGGSSYGYRSTRSINTVSSHSTHSHSPHPDRIDSSVVSDPAVEEALHHFESESCDLLDILTAMRRFPNDQRVQERGCEKLWIQSWDDENSSAIGRVGGISILLNAMASFPRSQRLQQSGCEALQNLALSQYNRDSIVENGGIRIVVNAMNNHFDVVGVQQCGCTALANIASSPDHHLDIANAGGLHAIMTAAQNNQDEEAVLRAAYQALRALGYDPNRHGPGAQSGHQQPQQQQPQQQQHQPQQTQTQPQPPAPAQENQPQQQPQQDDEQSQRQDVIRLDQHGFPIN